MAALPPIEIDVRADTAGAEAGLDRVGDAAERAGRRAGAGADEAARGSRRLGGATGQLRGQMQNTSFQLQDMIVQLQMGTNWTTVMAQQLPQLAGGFGAVGAAVGVLAAVGFVGLGIAMKALGGETREYQEILEDLQEAIEKYQSAVDLANSSTDDMREQFGLARDDLRSTLAILEQIAANEAQRAIDDLSNSLSELMGTAGAGDVRTALANFFDLNIGLAFTDAQREMRSEARELTAEFKNQQDALRDSAGDLDAQRTILAQMVTTATQLADANGERTAEEEALIKQLAESLLLMEQQRGVVVETNGEVELVSNAMDTLNGLIDDAVTKTTSLRDMFIEVAGSIPSAHDIINRSFALNGEVGRGGAGPGGPMSAADRFIAGSGGVDTEYETPGVPARGGGGPADTTAGDLEALQKQLMTERELIASEYESRMELLVSAREMELLTEAEYAEAKLRVQENRVNEENRLNTQASQHELNMRNKTVNGVIGLFQTLGTKNKAFAKAAVALNAAKAIGETIQNTAAASVRALAELGPIAGPPAAAAIQSYGALQAGIIGANAALSMGGSGGGGGSGGLGRIGAGGGGGQQQQPATTFAFTIQNDPMGFGESFARQMIEQLNASQRNGGRIQGVIA